MSRHSERFIRLREEQRLSEQSLRDSIDQESEKMEKSMIGFLKAGGLSIVLAGVGYLAFRAVGGNEPNKKGAKKEKKKSKKKASVNKASWLEPLLLLAAKNGMNYLVDRMKQQGATGKSRN